MKKMNDQPFVYRREEDSEFDRRTIKTTSAPDDEGVQLHLPLALAERIAQRRVHPYHQRLLHRPYGDHYGDASNFFNEVGPLIEERQSYGGGGGSTGCCNQSGESFPFKLFLLIPFGLLLSLVVLFILAKTYAIIQYTQFHIY